MFFGLVHRQSLSILARESLRIAYIALRLLRFSFALI